MDPSYPYLSASAGAVDVGADVVGVESLASVGVWIGAMEGEAGVGFDCQSVQQ